jgi:hypothetical protein
MPEKPNLLVVPADSIMNGVSRSHYFCTGLMKDFTVYRLVWDDPQNSDFENLEGNKFYTLKCFISSIFTQINIRKNDDGLWIVHAPRISLLVIHRIIGITNALKFARFFNKIILKKLIKTIEPSAVFYADGCDLYPIVPGKHINITDIQDDFSDDNFRANDYQRAYGKLNYNLSSKNYIVSRSAAEKLGFYYSAEFEYLPNGADFNGLKNIDKNKLNNYKKNYHKEDCLNVSYIGGRAWYDDEFANDLFQMANNKYKNIHFYIIGNHVEIDLPNVTFLGPLSNEETYYFYNLCDVGIMLKDSKNSEFLENSVPLKIVQYSALDKYFISPKINWLVEEHFSNVNIIEHYSPINLLEELNNFFLKGKVVISDSKWEKYNWDVIVDNISNFLQIKIGK